MYRFLLTPRWLVLAATSLVLAVVMVGLGRWQLYRYHLHASINDRVAAAAAAAPVPVNQVLRVGVAPPSSQAWTKVTLTGRYDAGHEILARERSVNSSVGFEVLVPLVLPDGTAAIVDRGWIPPAPGGSLVLPDVPAVPRGTVTVIGRVHLPESGPTTPIRIDGRPQVRMIDPAKLAALVPHPLYGGYILLDQQQPPASTVFVSIPSDHENAWQNAGYVIQWWLFAAMVLIGYVLLARREAHPEAETGRGRDRAGRDRDPTYTGYDRDPTYTGYDRDPTHTGHDRDPTHTGHDRDPTHTGYDRDPTYTGHDRDGGASGQGPARPAGTGDTGDLTRGKSGASDHARAGDVATSTAPER